MAAVLSGCLGGSQDTPTVFKTDPEPDTQLANAFYLESGDPAFGAFVEFYPRAYLPGIDRAGVYTTQTNAGGRYSIDTLVPGVYDVVAYRKDFFGTIGSYRDSVVIKAGTKAIPFDTLRATGSMTGLIRLQPQQDPSKVSIILEGTGWIFKPDAQGRFMAAGLPGGQYRFVATTSEPDYLPLKGRFTVRIGKSDTLSVALQPEYHGMPVVTGLKVAYDTANGLARISWNKPVWAALKSYRLYRDALKGIPIVHPTFLAGVSDTEYIDTLIRIDPFSGRIDGYGDRSDSLKMDYEYSVAPVDDSGKTGVPWGRLSVTAPSPFFVRTDFSFSAVNLFSGKTAKDNTVSLGDSVRIEASFSNPTRKLKRAQWYRADLSAKPFQETELDTPSRKGMVDVIHVVPSVVGPDVITIKGTDEAGSSWFAQMTLLVVEDKPNAYAGFDTTVATGTPATLHGSGSDGFGRIVKWEWDIGATGKFVETSKPETTLAGSGVYGDLICVLRVTDDDGLRDSDTVKVSTVFQWEAAPLVFTNEFNGAFAGQRSLVFAGKLWMLGGLTFNPAPSDYLPLNHSTQNGRDWETLDSSQVFPCRAGHGAVVFKNKMWVLGGRVRKVSNPQDPANSWIYHREAGSDAWCSSDGKKWDRTTADGFPALDGFSTVVFQDRIWVIGGIDNNQVPSSGSYFSEDGMVFTQTAPTSPLPALVGSGVVVFKGKIYVIGGYDQITKSQKKEIWSSGDGINWIRIQTDAPFGTISGFEAIVYNDRIWLIGGAKEPYHYPENPGSLNSFFNYNKNTWYSEDGINWKSIPAPVNMQRTTFASEVFNGRLWVLFGYTLLGEGFAESVYSGH